MTVRSPRRTPVVPITSPTFSAPTHAAFYRRIAYSFFALTAIILIGILWLSSVRATVDVHVRRTPVRTDDPVTVTLRPSGGTQIAGRVLHLPIRKTQAFEVRGVADTAPTATTSSQPVTPAAPIVPSSTSPSTQNAQATAYAKGQITITNNYSKSQTLVERTRFVTEDGKLFRLDQRVTIPAGGHVSAAITADQPGSTYAITPAKLTIPGLWIDLQKLIYGESTEVFTMATSSRVGGTAPAPSPAPVITPAPIPSGDRRVVTQQNIDDAYQALTDQVVDQAKRTLAASVTDARFNGAAYFVNYTDKSVTVKPGQVANTFTAQVDIEVIGVFYSDEDMQGLIRSKLREHLPDGQEFLPLNEQDFIYTLETVDKNNESAQLRVIANAEYRLTQNTPALNPGTIAGKSKDEAIQILKGIDGVDSVDITLQPGWTGKIPRLTDHIKMEIE
ncbi:hypothetical protein KBB27_03895 [Patescibacteria group bacterium]|nr:hypothetical protein [Patescibacteria group bacterium]